MEGGGGVVCFVLWLGWFYWNGWWEGGGNVGDGWGGFDVMWCRVCVGEMEGRKEGKVMKGMKGVVWG